MFKKKENIPARQTDMTERVTDVADKHAGTTVVRSRMLFNLHRRLHTEMTRVPRSVEGGPQDNRHKKKREMKKNLLNKN
jgi:hypothetical protein